MGKEVSAGTKEVNSKNIIQGGKADAEASYNQKISIHNLTSYQHTGTQIIDSQSILLLILSAGRNG